MLRLAFDFIITWRETRTRPNAYLYAVNDIVPLGWHDHSTWVNRACQPGGMVISSG